MDEAAAEAGRALRAAWGVPAGAVLGLGLGHGDLRKGFDLFLDVFGHAGGAVHMAWVGTVDPALAGRLAAPLQAAMATGRFHLPGWLDDPAPALAAADRLLLTSREDPYPSVVLEALAAGVAVTGFAGSGGVVALLYGPAGCCVAMGDCAAMADTLAQKVAPRRPLLEGHDFGGYAAALLRLACPGVQRISVVLPVFDNARLLAARLACVFAQDMPVAELVLHDDGSGDGGAAVAGRLAAAAGRELRIVRHAANSGSPFGRWAQAVDEAHGELVWIAEADDGCAPDFLSRLAPLFDDPAMLFAYAGSVPVGPDGAELDALSDMYRSGPDEVMEARAFLEQRMAVRNALFNVSAVVFRRRVLLAALRRIGPGLARWQVAGDWRVYVEILGGTGRVGQVQAVLNRHCRAGGSASARVKAAAHLGEISRMHRLIRRRLGDEAGLRARQAQALDAARAFLGG